MNMNYVAPSANLQLKLADVRSEINRCLNLLDDIEGREPETHGIKQQQIRTFKNVAENILKLRRKRDSVIGEDLFNEPIWDMLLSLYVDELAGRQVGVSSLAIASAVPATTALRHIDIMYARGLIVRRPDPQDNRRSLLSLTDDTVVKIEKMLTMAMSL